MRLRAAVAALCLISWASPAATQPRGEDVYRLHKDRVLRVRVLENSSGSQSSVGSGFFVDPDGVAVTNFHVISSLVWEDGDYKAVAVSDDGQSRDIELLDVDIVHDLALFRVPGAKAKPLRLSKEPPPKGRRLYALGNPHDLGMTLVEGSFSGLLDESLVERVHFTGSVNPGMSGGPVLDASGEVVGISVASSGEQVGFLVPAAHARALLSSQRRPGGPAAFREAVAAQLAAHQEAVMARLTSAPFASQPLGPFQVPGRLTPALHCWANSDEGKHQPFEAVHSECGTDHDISVDENLTTGAIRFTHHGLKSERLNAFQFAAMQDYYLTKDSDIGAASFLAAFRQEDADESLTAYDCSADVTELAGMPVKGIVCLRAYKKMPGLYDLHWRGASLVEDRRGFTSMLRLEGVTRPNAERFLKRYLEAFSWTR